LGFLRGRIGYGGMPNDQTFSLGLRKWDFIHAVYAFNLFYPREQSEISIDGIDIQVEEVTPSEIRLRIR